MSEPQRHASDDEHDDAVREAEAAVRDVLVDVARRREAVARAEARQGPKRVPPTQALLLVALLALQAYVWFARPAWLMLPSSPPPSYRYYVDGYRMAVALERDRIETFRANHGQLPLTAQQAGRPVPGVSYAPQDSLAYVLSAGDAHARVQWSSRDSLDRSLAESVGRLHLFEQVPPR